MSQKVSDQHGFVTVETDVTDGNTPYRSNDKKPDHPCYTCGMNNWWKRGREWLCGCCHPDPRGEILFTLETRKGVTPSISIMESHYRDRGKITKITAGL